MSHEWWLPRDVWYAMSPELQRLHRIKVAAYFLGEQRQKDGSPGTSDDDWFAAEWETDRWLESFDLYCRMKDSTDVDEKIRLGVLHGIADKLKMKASEMTGQTPLPTDRKELQCLCSSIGYESIGSAFKVSDGINTVGELTAALLAAPRPPRRQALRA